MVWLVCCAAPSGSVCCCPSLIHASPPAALVHPCREELFRRYTAELGKGEEVLREREAKQREAERRLEAERRVAEQRQKQVGGGPRCARVCCTLRSCHWLAHGLLDILPCARAAPVPCRRRPTPTRWPSTRSCWVSCTWGPRHAGATTANASCVMHRCGCGWGGHTCLLPCRALAARYPVRRPAACHCAAWVSSCALPLRSLAPRVASLQGRGSNPALERGEAESVFREHVAELQEAVVEGFLDLLDKEIKVGGWCVVGGRVWGREQGTATALLKGVQVVVWAAVE